MDSIEFIENLFHRANNTKQDTFSIVGEGDVEGNTITLVKKNLDGILVKRTGGKPFEMASVDIVDNLLASSKTLVFVEKASVKK